MNAIAQRARAAALSCEAKKHAYRQTQDGVVVSFVLHPQEVPDKLAIAPLGTRYSLVVVEIGDDEQPKGGDATARRKDQPVATAPGPAASPDRARKAFIDMIPAAQAGMLCADVAFQEFVRERTNADSKSETLARNYILSRCNIESRADLNTNRSALEQWVEIVQDYRAWWRAPEFA